MSCDIFGHLCRSPQQSSLHDGSPALAAGFSAPAASAQPLYPVADHAGWQLAPVQLPDVPVIPAVVEMQSIIYSIQCKAATQSLSTF